MKQIPLTQGKVAVVDDADFGWLNQWKWYAKKDKYGFYAARNIRRNNKRTTLRMHQVIMGASEGAYTDHRNGDGLKNTRDNLRLCSRRQNSMNRRPNKNNTSGYKGVHWHKGANKWVARIGMNNKKINLGVFSCLIKAAKAYDEAAIRYYGQFANTNF